MAADAPAHLWTLHHRVLTRVLRAAAPRLEELGLESKELFVLDEVDACRYPAVIAQRLLIPKASVTVYVRNLVAKGLVVRAIDDDDLRRHRLATTEAGRQVLGEAQAALSAEFARTTARLAPADRAELLRLLTELDRDG